MTYILVTYFSAKGKIVKDDISLLDSTFDITKQSSFILNKEGLKIVEFPLSGEANNIHYLNNIVKYTTY